MPASLSLSIHCEYDWHAANGSLTELMFPEGLLRTGPPQRDLPEPVDLRLGRGGHMVFR
jgi:hypothetical protein